MAGPPQALDEQQTVCPIAVLMAILRRLFGDAALSGPGAAEPSTNGAAHTGHAALADPLHAPKADSPDIPRP